MVQKKIVHIFSRTMAVTGSIILIFLVSHLATFFWRFNVHDPMGLATHHQYYDVVVYFFNIWWYAILYVVAMILLRLSSKSWISKCFSNIWMESQ